MCHRTRAWNVRLLQLPWKISPSIPSTVQPVIVDQHPTIRANQSEYVSAVHLHLSSPIISGKDGSNLTPTHNRWQWPVHTRQYHAHGMVISVWWGMLALMRKGGLTLVDFNVTCTIESPEWPGPDWPVEQLISLTVAMLSKASQTRKIVNGGFDWRY